MRLQSVKGRSVESMRRDSTRRGAGWALGWEYRATYRDHLAPTETVVKGSWQGAPLARSIFVSVEVNLARDLGVDVGDEIVFDVQGLPVEVTVGSLRKVEWQRVSPNFLVLFPTGVLKRAPQFWVLVTRSEAAPTSATLQRLLAESYPNVSVIDLDLILSTANSLLDRASLVIRLVASFSVATGLLVLVAVLSNSRFQRLKECILLKALGATRSQIWRIMLLEYLFLGGFAAVTGLLLAVAGNWGLTHFVFEVAYAPALLPLVAALGGVMMLTALFGVGVNRGILDRPPLHALRAEG
jgi:putative ABC transport system permease protein